MEIKKRHDMSKSEVKKLLAQIDDSYVSGELPSAKGRYEVCETDKDIKVILYEGSSAFLIRGESVIPSLRLFLASDVRTLPHRIIVDMGAIRFVTNGADIMRPGITDADPNISEGSFVVIGDVNHGKPLAIGIAMYSGEELLAMDDGKVVKNLHYVGDSIWNLEI